MQPMPCPRDGRRGFLPRVTPLGTVTGTLSIPRKTSSGQQAAAVVVVVVVAVVVVAGVVVAVVVPRSVAARTRAVSKRV